MSDTRAHLDPPSLGADPARRARAFPDLPRDAVLLEDDDVVVVDKPEGVPSQEVRPGDGDDLPARLRRFLAARDGVPEGDVYLGAHQRLDAATSGAILYTRRRSANVAIAREMEGRRARKEYVAAVVLPSGGAKLEGAVLRDRIAKGKDGRSAIVRAGGDEAISHVHVLRQRGARALVSVRIETGKTHQIRAQLAHRGAPVAGDLLYGGPEAERLLLHAHRLALAHPTGAGRIEATAPLPAAFERWLGGDARSPLVTPELLRERLARAATRRLSLARAALAERPTTAFRLVHEGGDALPGIAVDVYGDWLVLHVYAEGLDEAPVLDALETLGMRGIYVKRRPAQANELAGDDLSGRAPAEPVRGEPAPAQACVLEHGVRYLVRLGDGLSTGLFLDQREHRERVREVARGRRVLNLFSYTCGFSVAAGVGGAARTLSVDASRRALDRGRANLSLSGLGEPAHALVCGDAFDVLASLARRKERFDLVVCDPPTYASTKSGRFTRKRWGELAERCLEVLAPGGLLLATSNDRGLPDGALVRTVRAACGRRAVERLVPLGAPLDFPAPPGEGAHLRGAWLELSK